MKYHTGIVFVRWVDYEFETIEDGYKVVRPEYFFEYKLVKVSEKTLRRMRKKKMDKGIAKFISEIVNDGLSTFGIDLVMKHFSKYEVYTYYWHDYPREYEAVFVKIPKNELKRALKILNKVRIIDNVWRYYEYYSF